MALKFQKILLSSGMEVVAPEIISASRATDISACYSDWLLHRVNKGYLKKINPYGRDAEYISFENAALFVFWTKNPAPLIQRLGHFDNRGIDYYFLYTLNNYMSYNLEPDIPDLNSRIETFKRLSMQIGKERVLWRFDPLILFKGESPVDLLKRIETVADKISNYTERLIISFLDINRYDKVRRAFLKTDLSPLEFTPEMKVELLHLLSEKNNERWGLDIRTCAEEGNYSHLGILPNKCIDDRLITELFNHNNKLMKFLNCQDEPQLTLFKEIDNQKTSGLLKDRGQRNHCNCILSKDIGEYNSCSNFCIYCYANHSRSLVLNNIKKHRVTNESILS